MSDEQISRLTVTEIRELIARLLEEIELRFITEQPMNNFDVHQI